MPAPTRTRLRDGARDVASALPLRASRLMSIARHARLYRASPGVRNQWASEDAVERSALGPDAPILPLGHGTRGATERPVEIGWVMSHADRGPGTRTLDVGSAYAPLAYRRLLRRWPAGAALELLDLVPCRIGTATAHVGDARRMPLPDGGYDTVVCISTLEHIGMDNQQYGVADRPAAGGDDDVVALREMGRVTRPGGRVLVTVPAGAAGDFGWFRQYSPGRWDAAVAAAGLRSLGVEYFAHVEDEGWTAVDRDAVEAFTYGVGAPAAAAIICAQVAR